MNTLGVYLERTLEGMTAYLKEDKILVIFIALLLLLWLKEKKVADNKGNRMLMYACFMTIVLLFPLTAMIMLAYQTAFYDYAWAWSMVPVIPVISYAVVLIYEEHVAILSKGKKGMAVCLALIVLFLCGNQGILKTADTQDASVQEEAAKLASYMEQSTEADWMLWAPKEMMQEVRRQTGEVRLIYGRDMWDEKSGAYDYEVYEEELVKAYEWMELLMFLAKEATGQESFDKLCDKEYRLMENAEEHMAFMLDEGVNSFSVPIIASKQFSQSLTTIATEYALDVEEVYTEQYVLYLLK